MAKDLLVRLENHPGTLAEMGEALGKAGVNIDGICGFPCGPEGNTHVLVENHQQARSLYQKQLVTDRYKITVYMNHDYGELFDLKNDPDELKNLWDLPEYSALKHTLILELLQSDMKQEAIVVERTAGA